MQYDQTVIFDGEELPELELRAVAGSGGTPEALANERALTSRLVADATGIYYNQLPASPQQGPRLVEPAIRKYSFADAAVTTFAAPSAAWVGYLEATGGRLLWNSAGLGWSSAPDGSDLVALGDVTSTAASDGARVYWTSAAGGGNIVSVSVAGGEREFSSCAVFDAGSLLADESGLYFLSRGGDRIVRLPKSSP